MKIQQEKEYKPLQITLETRSEYDDFFRIVEEALDKNVPVHMKDSSRILASELSEYATSNTQ